MIFAFQIGNPLLDGLVDFPEEIFFEWTHGLISDSTYANVMSSCNFSVVAVLNKECSIAIVEADRELSDFIDPYNVLVDVCLSPRTEQEKRLKWSRVSSQPYHLSLSLSCLFYCGYMDVWIR